MKSTGGQHQPTCSMLSLHPVPTCTVSRLYPHITPSHPHVTLPHPHVTLPISMCYSIHPSMCCRFTLSLLIPPIPLCALIPPCPPTLHPSSHVLSLHPIPVCHTTHPPCPVSPPRTHVSSSWPLGCSHSTLSPLIPPCPLSLHPSSFVLSLHPFLLTWTDVWVSA